MKSMMSSVRGLVQDFGFSDDLVCIVGNGLRVYW